MGFVLRKFSHGGTEGHGETRRVSLDFVVKLYSKNSLRVSPSHSVPPWINLCYFFTLNNFFNSPTPTVAGISII